MVRLTYSASQFTGMNMEAVLLVTGASRGMGAAIALAGARVGYRVCINYNRSRSPAEALQPRISNDGGHAIAVQADVGDSRTLDLLFRAVDEQLSPLTALL